MASSWIKVEVTTSQKVEVLTIADLLDMDPHTALGKLVVLWCWADVNTIDGHANGVTKVMVDSVVGHKGFAEAMLDKTVGWLRQEEDGSLYFSNFDRHNGKGAKKRSVDARRKSNSRSNIENMSRNNRDEILTNKQTRSESEEDKKSNNNGQKKSEPNYHEHTDSVIDYLNAKANSRFTKSNTSRQPISARLNEGYTYQDCCLVIDAKVLDWGNNKYANYLRPKTLFSSGNFAGYLNAASKMFCVSSFNDDEVL